jgi:phospholipase C
VIFIERASSSGLDEHPDNNIQTGAAKAAQIINALLNSAAWKSSVFIETYDEFGGLYDHVPIQSAPAPDNIAPICTPGFDSRCEPGDFAHTGFRIPLIVISPWVKPHFVSKKVRETTSILKLIETRFGLQPLTARDAWADDMTEFFDFVNPAWQAPPPLPAQPTNETCDFKQEIKGQQ